MRWAAHTPGMREKRNAYGILVRKRPLGRPRHRWEDNIKIDLKRHRMEWCELDMALDRDL
jgi:hypothetical protein